MATFNVTVSNTLNVLGPDPTSMWGSMVWGTDDWGSTGDSYFTIIKYLGNSVSLSSTVSAGRIIAKQVSNTISCVADANLVGLLDAAGYYYNEKDGPDPDDRYFPTYTEDTDPSTTYTQASNPSTDWDDA